MLSKIVAQDDQFSIGSQFNLWLSSCPQHKFVLSYSAGGAYKQLLQYGIFERDHVMATDNVISIAKYSECFSVKGDVFIRTDKPIKDLILTSFVCQKNKNEFVLQSPRINKKGQASCLKIVPIEEVAIRKNSAILRDLFNNKKEDLEVKRISRDLERGTVKVYRGLVDKNNCFINNRMVHFIYAPLMFVRKNINSNIITVKNGSTVQDAIMFILPDYHIEIRGDEIVLLGKNDEFFFKKIEIK